MSKKNCLICLAFLFFAGSIFAASTIVTDTYNGEHFFPLSTLATTNPIKSCYVQVNYESGQCDYVYACYAVLPIGAVGFSNAFMKECIEVTALYQTSAPQYYMSFVFSPPKGYRLAVTWFVAKLSYTYNSATKVWSTPVSSLVYKSAAEIVSLCPEGKMLRGTMCYPAQAFCVNSLGTNMCDNPYQLYMLDYGQGFEPTNYARMCADRENDKVCDETVSLFCSDINLNGICDESEVQIGTNACIDLDRDRVCDAVETEGTFCRVYYEPVCDTATNITYPNKCFADAAKKVTVAGECVPIEIEIQCRADTDCFIPCEGVATSCNNYQCQYMGECNPAKIQCTIDADCPQTPCIGVSAQCNTSVNTCNYIGKCIEQPQKPANIWTILAGIFAALFNWIKSLFWW